MLRTALSGKLGSVPLTGLSTLSSIRQFGKLKATAQLSYRPITTSSASPEGQRFKDSSRPPENVECNTAAPADEQDPVVGAKSASPGLEALRTRFKDLSHRNATAIRRRVDDFTAKTSSTFSQLGSQLNRVTGYEEIEALKARVETWDARLTETRKAARESKVAYEDIVVQRAVAQQHVQDLLLQKPAAGWPTTQLTHFTQSLHETNALEQKQNELKVAMIGAEAAFDEAFSGFMKAITERYHEEQIWSDKIRSASTYGSLTVLAINLVVFILAIVLVEPWKRKRLAQTFERKVEELSVENTATVEGGMKELARHFVEQERLLAEILETRPASLTAADNSVKPLVHTPESPIVEKIAVLAKDRELASAWALSVVLGGVVSWALRSLLG